MHILQIEDAYIMKGVTGEGSPYSMDHLIAQFILLSSGK